MSTFIRFYNPKVDNLCVIDTYRNHFSAYQSVLNNGQFSSLMRLVREKIGN